VRLIYFFKTGHQALWWDEAEYMSTAKHIAFDVPYQINPQRPPLFQFMSAIAFMMGLNEMFIRFAFVVIPSVFLVFAIYLLGKEMYNKKVGLMAAFLAALSWTFLFWTSRVQPDSFSLSFGVLAFYFMWRYWKEEKTKLIVWAGIFSAFCFLFKVSGLLVPVSFMVFILIKDRLSAFFKKDYYLFSLAFLATLTPYLIWAYKMFGTPIAFTYNYSNAVVRSEPFAWHVFGFFYTLSENILFILFILGLILALKFLLYADILAKDKKKCLDAGLFGVIVLMVVSAFYIFYIRSIEDRWVFLWMPFIFLFIGNVLDKMYEFGKKYTKVISVLVVVVLLAVGGYMQYKHADSLIENKLDSYGQVKDASLWIKENSEKNDRVLSISYPQTVYYSERNVSTYSSIESAEAFKDYINATNPRYMIVSAFEQHPAWIDSWMQSTNDTLVANVYYSDKARTKPILVVYEFKRYAVYS
jgi:4-amino-4-deoxy-L-arabinose transferase-like glycosyltransferase